MRELRVYDLGLLHYSRAYAFQKEILELKRRNRDESDVLLFVEHPPVYTFGRRSKHIPTIPGAEIFEIERGGEATYHNPGQLVFYPILFLEKGERDLHAYLRKLEQVIIHTLQTWNLRAHRRSGATGVWIEDSKIASIGVAVSGWITYHGCALNVRNDLSGFGAISPCGFDAKVMTSMKSLLQLSCPTMNEIHKDILEHFGQVFKRTPHLCSLPDLPAREYQNGRVTLESIGNHLCSFHT